ncbi:MAG: hypothetical protein LC115_13710 [Bacteroidia bacterium]|nr:hypothetical protein [Bacteroidia bacterium]
MATITASVITFFGIVVTGYFSIRSAERPVELAISATQTAGAVITSVPTVINTSTPQTVSPNSSVVEIISANVLKPTQDETHPLFKGEYEFAIYSAEPIVIEFTVINNEGKPIDTKQVFTVPDKGFEVLLYLPDYTYKTFSISPVNLDSSLNNRYYGKINIPPSGMGFLEGEYILEIKPNLQYINPSFQFDEKSYLVKFHVKNILDTGRIFTEVFTAFVIFLVSGIALLNFYVHRYFAQKPKSL